MVRVRRRWRMLGSKWFVLNVSEKTVGRAGVRDA